MTSTGNDITYRMSSRAFQDFLAGRITEEQFRHFLGDAEGGSTEMDPGFGTRG
ncbi:hypothetical protein ABIF69_010956 [Bradyrhizobium japonicum]